MIHWIQLISTEQLTEISNNSYNRPQVVYKHSTRCGISSVVQKRLERSIIPGEADFYFLDLIKYRDISNKIASTFNVYHESPQILVIRNGECVYDESHYSITMEEIAQMVTV